MSFRLLKALWLCGLVLVCYIKRIIDKRRIEKRRNRLGDKEEEGGGGIEGKISIFFWIFEEISLV